MDDNNSFLSYYSQKYQADCFPFEYKYRGKSRVINDQETTFKSHEHTR